MLKIENTEVMGWEHAIRGMRNPKNSWEKTDSYPAVDCGKCGKIEREGICKKEDRDCTGFECFEVGPNDLKLMTTLRNAGTDHRKFMRMITVYLDITAPLYWWKEFDTYKVGTVANSCSTMHKIADKEFTLDDFSYEHLNCEPYHRDWIESATVDEDITSPHKVWMTPLDILRCTIEMLNAYRESYLETKDKQDWWQMIQLLITESCVHYGRCAVKTQRNMNARDTGINIKSARMKTHMNVSTLSRRRNSNKRFPARKIHPLL